MTAEILKNCVKCYLSCREFNCLTQSDIRIITLEFSNQSGLFPDVNDVQTEQVIQDICSDLKMSVVLTHRN